MQLTLLIVLVVVVVAVVVVVVVVVVAVVTIILPRLTVIMSREMTACELMAAGIAGDGISLRGPYIPK